MKVAILDDCFDTLRTLPCFRKLDGHGVTVWTSHAQAPLLDRLDALRLFSQRRIYPHIDIEACTRRGVIVSSHLHEWSAGGSPASRERARHDGYATARSKRAFLESCDQVAGYAAGTPINVVNPQVFDV